MDEQTKLIKKREYMKIYNKKYKMKYRKEYLEYMHEYNLKNKERYCKNEICEYCGKLYQIRSKQRHIKGKKCVIKQEKINDVKLINEIIDEIK